MSGEIPYEEIMSDESTKALFPQRFNTLYWRLKATAQLQVFIGLVTLALGALADYQSISSGGLRAIGIPEICGAYFVLTGIVGISGSASYRRGLMVAFMVMSLHALFVFAPAIIASGVAGCVLTSNDCWIKYQEGSFGIYCGQVARDAMMGNPETMTQLDSDMRLEGGLFAIAGIELIVAVVTSIFCCLGVCEKFGWVDGSLLDNINKLTKLSRSDNYPDPAIQIQVPTVSRHIDVS